MSLLTTSAIGTVFPYLGVRAITPVMFSRDQLKRAASLTEEDFVEIGKCRRPHNRRGFPTRSPSSESPHDSI